jgi:hypothetical protein
MLLLLFACASPPPAGSTPRLAPAEGTPQGDDTAAALPLEITTAGPCHSPCALRAEATGAATLRWSRDGVLLGEVAPDEALLTTVSADGVYAIEVSALGADGEPLALAQAALELRAPSLTLEAPAVCQNPCTLSAHSPGAIAAVAWSADGYPLGDSTAPDFSLTYTFTTLGERRLQATALDQAGAALVTVEQPLRVQTAPAELASGDRCTTPCTFTAHATAAVARVAYEADGWTLGESTDVGRGFAITYDFSTLGSRQIALLAYDADGALLGTSEGAVLVEDDATDPTLPDLPYFYQYDNALYPGSTCQNTSVAMLLAGYGWTGVPDDITADWGKDYAQTPANLATLFNTLAAEAGISARLTAHTDGSLADMQALLDAGKPVIVHGYFTSAGHVLVALGYDADSYTVNDPAGTWAETFMGGYPFASDSSTSGDHIRYDRDAFEDAIATWDGSAPAPLWYHELR